MTAKDEGIGPADVGGLTRTDFVALEKVHLPVVNDDGFVTGKVEKNTGDTITADELAAAGQGADDIATLVEHGSICTPDEYETRLADAKAAQATADAEAGAARNLRELGFSDDEIAATLAARKGGAS